MSGIDDLVDVMRAALPPDVTFAGGTIAGSSGDVFAEEEAALGAAGEKRRNEFRAGRYYARLALASLGLASVAITVDRHRAPVWPSGAVGSITHTDRYCGALVALSKTYAGVGLDMESAGALEVDLVEIICSDIELHGRARVESQLETDLPKLIFSAKESVYKACPPALQRYLDFDRLAITVDPERRTFGAKILVREIAALGFAEVSGGFLTHPDIVVTWTTIPL